MISMRRGTGRADCLSCGRSIPRFDRCLQFDSYGNPYICTCCVAEANDIMTGRQIWGNYMVKLVKQTADAQFEPLVLRGENMPLASLRDSNLSLPVRTINQYFALDEPPSDQLDLLANGPFDSLRAAITALTKHHGRPPAHYRLSNGYTLDLWCLARRLAPLHTSWIFPGTYPLSDSIRSSDILVILPHPCHVSRVT